MKHKSGSRLKTAPKTVRLHPESRRLIVNSVLSELKNMMAQASRSSVAGDPQQTVPATAVAAVSPAVSVPFDAKKLRVLMVSSLEGEELWLTEQAIAEQLRLLVRELISIKAYPSFTSAISLLNPDLLLIVGNDQPFTDDDMELIRCTPVTKAVWLNDAAGTDEATGRLAAYFDAAFTQNPSHVSFYRHLGSKLVTFLPFPAHREVFFPKYARPACQSEVLVLGDITGPNRQWAKSLLPLLESRKVFAAGEGWSDVHGVHPLAEGPGRQEYYCGAQVVIHWGQPSTLPFQLSACGAFQLAQDEPGLYIHMNPGEDLVTFHTPQELAEKLQYYMDNPELMRAVASRALWRSTYDYAFLQMATKLLHTVYGY